MSDQSEAQWPAELMIRDTGIHDDLGGLGQRIYTTAGAGYEKVRYVRADRIEADEALMRQALEAFEEGCDALQERASRYHDEMRGYYPDEHKAMDQDVVRADAAITALRTRLEKTQ